MTGSNILFPLLMASAQINPDTFFVGGDFVRALTITTELSK